MNYHNLRQEKYITQTSQLSKILNSVASFLMGFYEVLMQDKMGLGGWSGFRLVYHEYGFKNDSMLKIYLFIVFLSFVNTSCYLAHVSSPQNE